MFKLNKFTLVAIGLAVLTATGTAYAQSTQDGGFQITPYLWSTGIRGDIRPFTDTPTVSIDHSFSDVFKDLDAAFFISAYARHGNLVFVGDFSTSSSSRSGSAPVPGTPVHLPATGKLRQTSLTALAGYRIASTADSRFDLLAGLRHWSVRGEIVVPPILGAFPGVTASRSRSFTDPLIAARANIQLAPGWSTLLYGDVGGFGVGSHRTAQLVGTVNYQIQDNAFLSVGYRYLHVDYRDGGTRFDMRMGGPLLGATVLF